MIIKDWVSCIIDTSEIYFTVWKNGWTSAKSVESVKELINKFGDEIIENVSIYDGDFGIYIYICIAD